MNWLLHFIGVRPTSGSGAYSFWSGFGSDIGEATIVVAVLGVVRHHNCHVKGCARLGKHEYEMDGAKYKLCRRHHPAIESKPTASAITTHHAKHKGRDARGRFTK